MRNWGLGFGNQDRWLGGALVMSTMNVITDVGSGHTSYLYEWEMAV